MVLDELPPSALLCPRADLRMFRCCERLMVRFSDVFPSISYDILWETDTCNAQAFRTGARWSVSVSGCLLSHRHVGIAGIAFTLAHETGHHLGGQPSLEYYPWLSSEARADAWAVSKGLIAVFGPQKARHYALNGQRQLA